MERHILTKEQKEEIKKIIEDNNFEKETMNCTAVAKKISKYDIINQYFGAADFFNEIGFIRTMTYKKYMMFKKLIKMDKHELQQLVDYAIGIVGIDDLDLFYETIEEELEDTIQEK